MSAVKMKLFDLAFLSGIFEDADKIMEALKEMDEESAEVLLTAFTE